MLLLPRCHYALSTGRLLSIARQPPREKEFKIFSNIQSNDLETKIRGMSKNLMSTHNVKVIISAPRKQAQKFSLHEPSGDVARQLCDRITGSLTSYRYGHESANNWCSKLGYCNTGRNGDLMFQLVSTVKKQQQE